MRAFVLPAAIKARPLQNEERLPFIRDRSFCPQQEIGKRFLTPANAKNRSRRLVSKRYQTTVHKPLKLGVVPSPDQQMSKGFQMVGVKASSQERPSRKATASRGNPFPIRLKKNRNDKRVPDPVGSGFLVLPTFLFVRRITRTVSQKLFWHGAVM